MTPFALGENHQKLFSSSVYQCSLDGKLNLCVIANPFYKERCCWRPSSQVGTDRQHTLQLAKKRGGRYVVGTNFFDKSN